MNLILITSIAQLKEYEDDWFSILEERDNTNPFIEFAWIYEWWKHLGDECQVEVILVQKDGETVGFFPFVIQNRGFLYMYYFMAYGQANYMDFVADDLYMDDSIHYVFDEIRRMRKNVVFYLHGLLESGGSPKRLEAYLRKSRIKFSSYKVITPYIDLKKIKTEEYMEKRVRLHRLDRREKRLRSIGNVRIEPTKLENMEEIFKLHEKHWKKKSDTSGFTNEKEKKFYSSLACIQEGPMKTEIDSLFMNDNVIAFNYGFNCRGKFIGYVLGFDNDFEAFSPGRILEKEKILQSKVTHYHIFDLSIGYEAYKFDWNTDVDYTTKMIFSSGTFIANASSFFLSMKETLIEKIKSNYKLVLFKRNKIGKLQYLIKNMFNKTESKIVRNEIAAFLILKKKNVYERKQYLVYKVDRKDLAIKSKPENFIELTMEDALKTPDIANGHMKEICRCMYGGYKGYYPEGTLSFDTLFWTNEKVLRIEKIAYIEDFRKSSIHIKDWNYENLEDVCSFVIGKTKARLLYLTVQDKLENNYPILDELGFTLCKKIMKRTYFGLKKVRIIE